MFAIVKTSEGWTVRDDEFGCVLDSYTRLSDAQARLALIAENTAILDSFKVDPVVLAVAQYEMQSLDEVPEGCELCSGSHFLDEPCPLDDEPCEWHGFAGGDGGCDCSACAVARMPERCFKA